MKKQIFGLLGWIAVSFAAAAVGGVASSNAADFYARLTLPAWAPPPWLFAPVWTLLYLLMAIAAWTVWRTHGFAGARIALIVFLVQLAVNALWTWLFFYWQLGAAALAEILILWVLIAWTATAFRRFSPMAAALLMPYLAWVTFASVLTYAIWRLNPAVLS